MFQHLDILYGTGSLALVWTVGNQRSSTVFMRNRRPAILRANIEQLCEIVRAQMTVPRSITSKPQNLNLSCLSILVLGLTTMYKVQLKSLSQRLDEILELLRSKIPEIDQPESRRVNQHTIGLDFSMVGAVGGAAFGSFEFDPTMEPIELSFRGSCHTPTPPLDSSMDVQSPLEVSTIIQENRLAKAAERIKRKSARRAAVKETVEDDILHMLGRSTTMARVEDITMREDESIAPPTENEYFRFDDEPMQNEEASELPPALNEIEAELPIATDQPTIAPGSPITTTTLEQRIQSDHGNSPANNVVTQPRRKRRRTNRLAIDDVIYLTNDDLRQQRRDVQMNSQQLRAAQNSMRMQLDPPNYMPIIKSKEHGIKIMSGRMGRQMGKTLMNFVSSIHTEQMRLNDETVRRASVSRDGNSVNEDQLRHNSESISGIRDLPDQPSSIATVSRTAEIPLISANEPPHEFSTAPLQNENIEPLADDNDFYTANETNITIVPEQILTPRASVVNETSVQQALRSPSHVPAEGKLFTELYPPASTSKQTAARAFYTLLKMQAEKKIKLMQEEMFGPLLVQQLANV